MFDEGLVTGDARLLQRELVAFCPILHRFPAGWAADHSDLAMTALDQALGGLETAVHVVHVNDCAVVTNATPCWISERM